MKILIRSPNWIGDQILSYPFFYYLREIYPKAEITVCCVPWVQAIQFKNLVDSVYVLGSGLAKGDAKKEGASFYSKFQALEAAARDLRKMGPWDLGISLPHSLSAAWLLFRSGVKRRRGYPGDGRSLLLNEVLDWKNASESHRAQAYVQLLTEGQGFQSSAVLKTFEAEKAWAGIPTIIPPETQYWILAPGATAESRRWPLKYYKELARQVIQETGWRGIIVGGTNEIPLAQQLIEQAPELQLQDWTARGNVASYWKVFRQARFTVCNESGLAHVAALCGSCVQIICGAAKPQRTEPLGPGKVEVFFNPVECWPCEKNICFQPQEKKIQCLLGIEPGMVWQRMKLAFSEELL